MVLHGTVRAYMTPDVDTVPWNAPLSQVARLLREHAYHHVPVVDGDRVVGILSALDLARVSLDVWGADRASTEAEADAMFDLMEIMTPEPDTVEATDPILRAAELLAHGAFHALPVTEGGRLVGMITSTDILRALLSP